VGSRKESLKPVRGERKTQKIKKRERILEASFKEEANVLRSPQGNKKNTSEEREMHSKRKREGSGGGSGKFGKRQRRGRTEL